MSSFRKKLQDFVDSSITQNVIIWLIILNALFMGLETFSWCKELFGSAVSVVDQIFIWVFLLEVVLKILAYGFRFFTSGWNNFDFFIVVISLIPGNSAFSALRAVRTLRIFRTVRLFGRIKNLRLIVGAMLRSLPKLGWLFLILGIFYYIFAVLSTSLFAKVAPEQFGTLWTSFYTLFSIMTMEGWQDTIDAVNSPYARWVFIPFMLLASYIFLNLVVGIIVAAMEEIVEQDKKEEEQEQEETFQTVLQRLDKIQQQLDRMEKN